MGVKPNYTFCLGWVMLLSLYFGLISVIYALPTAKEYEIKALFLYHFTSFVSWPASAFKHQRAPFQICILGQDPFGKVIDITILNQKVDEHPLVVKRLNTSPALRQCHILFFNQLEDKQLHEAFKMIKGAAILTVSDMSNFIREGGMIEFFKQRNKVKIGINPEALQAVDLKARAQLLNLSDIKTP